MTEIVPPLSSSTRPVNAEVHRALREAILTGKLKPNERLVQMQIAEQLGVSRTPVREAMLRLTEEGLIRMQPDGSAVAVWFDAAAIQHIYSIRARVEGYAASLVASCASDSVLDELESIAARFADSPHSQQDALNRLFHQTLIQSCGHEVVSNLAMRLVDQSLMSRLYLLHTPTDRARSIREHSAIAKALRSRDGATADRLVCEHLEWARDILLGRLP